MPRHPSLFLKLPYSSSLYLSFSHFLSLHLSPSPFLSLSLSLTGEEGQRVREKEKEGQNHACWLLTDRLTVWMRNTLSVSMHTLANIKHARTQSAPHHRDLYVPHSFSQSECVIIILITDILNDRKKLYNIGAWCNHCVTAWHHKNQALALPVHQGSGRPCGSCPSTEPNVIRLFLSIIY